MNLGGWVILALIVCVIGQYLFSPQKPATIRRNAASIAAILTVNAMSALDAVSTIYLVAHNHTTEMNPFMDALIQRSYLLFFAVKMALTLIATLICCYYYERKQEAKTILRLTSRVYCGLMLWHCLLLSSVLL
jgi:hypothetical protein